MSAPIKAIESYISFKINNEIITNLDIDFEYQYLIALNNELKNTDKKTILKLAKDSIIKETVKKNELQKFFKLGKSENFLDEVIKTFYEKIGMNNLNEFENYLSEYNLELKEVKDKIEIEMLWNKLIVDKYTNQLDINEELIKKHINENLNDNEFTIDYELSEIVFQTTDEIDLESKVNAIKKDIKELGFKNASNIHGISESSKFGGKIGWFNEKQLSLKIINSIKGLEIDKLSKPIEVTNGFMILKIDNIKKKNIQMDKKKIIKEAIDFEKNKQLSQFSIIYYNKILLNSIISE